MRIFKSIIIVCFLICQLQKGNAQISLTGNVFGSVIDSISKMPVEFATVAIFKTEDSTIVNGGLTDAKGNFKIESLPQNDYLLLIQFMGYKNYRSQKFSINNKILQVDLGKIIITPTGINLKQVEITGEKSNFINNVERKVYNVDKNVTNIGGSTTDVLRNIPSVTVDIDNKISLRGSANVTILIDGKPSTLTGSDRQGDLQQIPASAIEQIEIIANPTAKYDADGMAGIINIKTKKDKLNGYNGTTSISANTNNGYNCNLSLNNRTSKYNLYGSYSLRKEVRVTTGNSIQHNFLTDTNYYYLTTTSGNFTNFSHTGKVGIDLFLNNYNTLGISAGISSRSSKRPEEIYYTYENSLQQPFYSYNNDNTSNDNNISYEGNVDYKHTFANNKREFTVSGNYSINLLTSDAEYKSSKYNIDGKPYQLKYTNSKFLNSTFQADYMHPFGEKAKLETGVKGTIRNNDNNQSSQIYNSDLSIYENNSNYTDHFIYNEQVYAAYAMYTQNIKKFTFNGGLRAEQALTSGTSQTETKNFTNNYFSLYPSASLKYTPKYSLYYQLSYSRRVNRPNMMALNPFADYSDSLNIRTGNPYLKPEYIDSYDLTVSKSFTSFTLTGSLFYRHTTNLISRHRLVDAQTGVAQLTWENFNSSDNYGVDASINYSIKQSGNIMISFSGFQNKINGSNVESDLQSDALSWNTRAVFNYKILKSTSAQATIMYMAPMKMPNSTFKGMSGVDVGVKQELWKGKASLALNIQDVFKQRTLSIHNYGSTYDYTGSRQMNFRSASLTFSYRFGSNDNNSTQRKRKGQPDQQIDSNDMYSY